MAGCCEKPVLIVEKGKDADKDIGAGGGGGGIVRSKSLDHLSFLVFAAKHTKILYSDNQKQTAELIKKLALAESKREKALPVSDVKVNVYACVRACVVVCARLNYFLCDTCVLCRLIV